MIYDKKILLCYTENINFDVFDESFDIDCLDDYIKLQNDTLIWMIYYFYKKTLAFY